MLTTKPSVSGWAKWKFRSKKGVMSEKDITGEIGDLLCGNVPGRENDQEITIFDATGLYILDLVAAKVAITKAKDAKIGFDVDM